MLLPESAQPHLCLSSLEPSCGKEDEFFQGKSRKYQGKPWKYQEIHYQENMEQRFCWFHLCNKFVLGLKQKNSVFLFLWRFDRWGFGRFRQALGKVLQDSFCLFVFWGRAGGDVCLSFWSCLVGVWLSLDMFLLLGEVGCASLLFLHLLPSISVLFFVSLCGALVLFQPVRVCC